MMSSARYRTPTNRALELIHTSKLWLLELIETTNNPPPSLWSQIPLVSRIPYLGAAIGAQAEEKPNHQASLEYYLTQLKKNLALKKEAQDLEAFNRAADGELTYFNKLKDKLAFAVVEQDQKLAFLVTYYGILNQLASQFTNFNPYSLEFIGQNEPRVRIIKALKDHYEANSKLAMALNLKPALLDKCLEERERSLDTEPEEIKPRFSTQEIEASISPARAYQQRPPLPTPRQSNNRNPDRALSDDLSDSSDLPSQPASRFIARSPSPPPINLNQRLNRSTFSGASSTASLPPLIVIHESCENELNGLHDEVQTLARYKEACRAYSLHLLAAILGEIETCYDNNDQHSLFGVLSSRQGNSPRKIAEDLLDSYYPTNHGRAIDTYLDLDRRHARKQMAIDLAIHKTRPQFHDAWEKYKLVRKLAQSQNVYAFHRLLNEGKNKEILTKRRDSHLMTFVKICGLAVATILGLPLGFVGGAYLGYKSLFGSRATEGHLFLKKIDQLTEEGKQPPQSRRCFIC